jgi:hypothetical protein
MIAHLYVHKGRLAWSGAWASGDPGHAPYAFVVDVGRDFQLTGDGRRIYLNGPGPIHHAELTPEAFIVAAKAGMFGFKILSQAEGRAMARDRAARSWAKLPARSRGPRP